MLRILPLFFAALARAAVLPVITPNDPLHGDSRGGVASEQAVCSDIGRNALVLGGNAADAMVATAVCVGVMAPYHTGIGGGGFAIVRDRNGEYEVIDFREAAPSAASEDMYEGNVAGSVTSGLAVAIPGEIRGLEYLHSKYCQLPWKTLFEPSIEIAREGFEISEDNVKYMIESIEEGNFLLNDPVWAEQWAPNGTLLGVGDTLYRKNYADTLERIAEEGADAFYTGPLAESMVSAIQAANGTMTLADLQDYKVISREVLSTTYRGHTLHTAGIPSSGSVAVGILKTMEQYPLEDSSDANLTIHRFSEAMKFAYGARLELGDPAFVPKAAAVEEDLMSESRARVTRRKILDDRTQPVDVYDPRGLYTADGHGTSHFSAVDSDGMAVSMTSTVNLLFGAQLMDPVTGVILNNEMNDFSIPGVPNQFGFQPSEANYIRPGKRPLSSITPFILTSPSSLVAVGAAGGSRIISSTVQSIWHLVEHGMSLAHALAVPRLHDQLMPNHVTFEDGFNRGVVESMAEKGHEVVWVQPGKSAVQGVLDMGGVFEAVGEPRQKSSGGSTG